ncbi:MAG: cytidylate kinase family protein [archaeon]
MIITLGFMPETKVEAIAKTIALNNGLKYYSMQTIDSELEGIQDNYSEKARQVFLSKTKNKMAIICHPLAAWQLFNADAKIFLQSLKKNRAIRLSEKEKIPIGEAMQKIDLMQQEQSVSLLKNYGIDSLDLSVYDLVLNIDKLDKDGITAIMEKFIEKRK